MSVQVNDQANLVRLFNRFIRSDSRSGYLINASEIKALESQVKIDNVVTDRERRLLETLLGDRTALTPAAQTAYDKMSKTYGLTAFRVLPGVARPLGGPDQDAAIILQALQKMGQSDTGCAGEAAMEPVTNDDVLAAHKETTARIAARYSQTNYPQLLMRDGGVFPVYAAAGFTGLPTIIGYGSISYAHTAGNEFDGSTTDVIFTAYDVSGQVIGTKAI